MKTSNQTISEGTWFVVPLRNGGFCRGLLARTNGKGIAFGYFFGPKRETVDALPRVSDLRSCDAILIGQFGDLGLLKGEWKIVGQDLEWDRTLWPMPPFVRVDEDAGTAMMATYNDDFDIVSDEPCDPSLAEEFPKDSLMGYGFVEIKLTRMLDSCIE